jgi:hypothetical protein
MWGELRVDYSSESLVIPTVFVNHAKMQLKQN